VCFVLNLVFAAWLKFPGELRLTGLLVTVTLAVCLLLVARNLAAWAPHLFSRGRWANESLREPVLQLGDETAMPFAWHRVPRASDVPPRVRSSHL
jgi:hypothetical protein